MCIYVCVFRTLILFFCIFGFLLKRKIANYFWLSFRTVGGNEPCFRRRFDAVLGNDGVFQEAAVIAMLFTVVSSSLITAIISCLSVFANSTYNFFVFHAHHWSESLRRGASLTSQENTAKYHLFPFNMLYLFVYAAFAAPCANDSYFGVKCGGCEDFYSCKNTFIYGISGYVFKVSTH